MPFGLINAPTAFQQFMNDIFSDLLDVCVVIYLDDILIYSNNMSKHHWHVKEVLKHLCKAGLYAKAEKCKILLQVSKVSGIYPFSFWPYHIWQQSKDYLGLAGTQESQGYLILLRFCKLLLLVHLSLLRYCYSIDTPYLEEHSLEVQLFISRCFQLSQESIYLYSYPYSLDFWCSTHHRNWCLGLCSGCNPLYC